MTGTAGRTRGTSSERRFEDEAPRVLASALATAMVLGGLSLAAAEVRAAYPSPAYATCSAASANAKTKKNIPAQPSETRVTGTETAASASSTSATTYSRTVIVMPTVVPTC